MPALVAALVLALLVAPPAGTAEIRGERFRELQPAPEAKAPGPWVWRRSLSLTPAPGGVTVRGRWQVKALAPGWFSGQVLGPTPGLRIVEARWGGQPATLKSDETGVSVAGRVAGSVELTLEAFVPGDPAQAPISLQVMPAASGQVTAAAPEGLAPEVKVDGAPALQVGAAAWSGGREIELSFGAPPAPSGDRPPVVVGKVGIGLTVGDAELRGRARAVWEVRQGEVAAVELECAGVGADLDVRGPNLRAWTRAGDRVRAELQAPARGRVELELSWTTPIAKAGESRAELPRVAAAGVFHGETALQLARDGEVEAVPEAPGWSPVASAALPGWAQGLVEGTPTASLRGGSGGSLSLLRFVPIEGPPVVVDVAAYTVATSREGRALIRAHYEVRNERAAHLRVTPPAGFRVIGVRVGGKAATPARTREGTWVVPLLRSVETVGGLLSFPVEINLLGESTEWRRRESRRLALPRVDAPVAVSRVTLHLPPGYRSRLEPGEGDVVAAFTRGEGITYGLGVGEVGAAQADMIFQDAVSAWMSNDFKGAQGKLDELKAMGAKNENIERLQSNLYVVSGKADASKDVTLQRRVREQAKARALADVQAQVELKKKAEEERARGDYEAAASSYSQALEVGDKLAALEQEESVDQRAANSEIEKEIQAVKSASRDKNRAKKAPPRKGRARGGKMTAVYAFDEDEVAGELVRPSGSATSSRGPDVDYDGIVDDTDKRPEEPQDAPTEGEAAAGGDGGIAVQGGAGGGGGGGAAEAPVLDLDGPPVPREPAAAEPPPDKAQLFHAPPSEVPEAPVPVVDAVAGTEIVAVQRQAVSRPLAGAVRRMRARFRQRTADTAAFVPPPAKPKPQAAPVQAPPPPGPVTTTETTATGAAVAVGGDEGVMTKAERDRARNIPAGMPTPVVHASALSVVVPTVGEAVRYQRLLLPAGATYEVEISAKEPLFARK